MSGRLVRIGEDGPPAGRVDSRRVDSRRVDSRAAASSLADSALADSSRAGRRFPLRRNTLSMQVHAALRRDIIAGRLAPRAMLSEQDIAAGFGISRTPVREA